MNIAPRTNLRVLTTTVLLVTGIVLVLTWADGSSGQEPEVKPPVEYFFSLKGKPEKESWQIIGAEKNVRFDDAGLRITLEPTRLHGPTGISTGIRVVGDFEIRVNYEILKEAPEPGDPLKTATRVAILVKLDREQKNTGGMARRITEKKGPGFTSWTTLWDPATTKNKTIGKEIEASAKSGRMRLVRNGSEISYFVSEGKDPDFHLMKTFEFTTDPIKDVELVANTGGPKGTIDVRLTDLHIRMGTPLVAPPPPVDALAEPRSGAWLVAVVLLGAALALVFVGVIVLWLMLRHRTAPTSAPDIFAECSGCGRQLTVKKDLAGKKVKCAQCGKVLTVPANAAEETTAGD